MKDVAALEEDSRLGMHIQLDATALSANISTGQHHVFFKISSHLGLYLESSIGLIWHKPII
jgi:hypothetical protein